MKIRLLTASMLSIYDAVFNIWLNTSSVLNQTIYFVLIATVVIGSVIKTKEEKMSAGDYYVSWSLVWYWSAMGAMYLFAWINYSNFETWIRFNENKTNLYYFIAAWSFGSLASWFLYREKVILKRI